MPGNEPLDIADLNQADEAAAAAMIVRFIERGPDLAGRIARHRPFAGPNELAEAIRAEILSLGSDELIALFRRHPELAPQAPETMTHESQEEQGRLGLSATAADLRRRLDELNNLYAKKFGFPFIVALHRHNEISSVIEMFEQRLAATPEDEIIAAREEVASVSRARVMAAFGRTKVAEA